MINNDRIEKTEKHRMGSKLVKSFIGLDLGSTATKAVLVSGSGEILDSAGERIVFKQSDQTNIREIEIDDYYNHIFKLIHRMSSQVDEVQAVSWNTASGNLLFLDPSGIPLTPIISWLDTRPVDSGLTAEDAGFTEDEIYTTVGWPFTLQFPFGRLLWIKQKTPDLLSSNNRVCMSNDYLGELITGNWAVDNSTATTFYMYDQQKMKKHLPYITSVGLEPGQLPEVHPVGYKLGSVTQKAAAITGLQEATEIVLGSFDHPGAARALQLTASSQLMFSCGTSWVGCVVLPDRETVLRKRMLVDPYESRNGGSWFGMFSLVSIGKYFDNWVTEFMKFTNFSRENLFRKFDLLAIKWGEKDPVPIIDPIENPLTRSLFNKLCGSWKVSAIARGVLEGVVFLMKKLTIEKGIEIDTLAEILLVGGPTESDIWPQIIADVFQKKVVIRFGETAGAVGAAVIAAKGVGTDLRPTCEPIEIIPNKRVAEILENRYLLFCRYGGNRNNA